MIVRNHSLRPTLDPDAQLLPRSSWWAESHALLPALDRALEEACPQDGKLGVAAMHHLRSGGKRLRGRLALAAGMARGLDADDALPLAVSVELLHHASLVHDDLQDGDVQRRGQRAVWSRFGKDTALLLGDALLASAFAAAIGRPSLHASRIARLLSGCVTTLAEGQVRDTDCGPQDRWDRRGYERLARAKTGRLLALPVELVLIAVGRPSDPARRAFEELGVAYQIQDDLADLAGAKGRPAASDLRRGRMSAVVLHAGSSAPAGRAALPVDAARGATEAGARLLRSRAAVASLLHQRASLRAAREAAVVLPTDLRELLEDVAEGIARRSFELVVPRDGTSPADIQVTLKEELWA